MIGANGILKKRKNGSNDINLNTSSQVMEKRATAS